MKVTLTVNGKREEVEVEARADDDHGVQGLELVYGVKGGSERVVPLGGDGATLTVTGHYTIPLEELQVSPGDFVTFYARARDIGRGKKPPSRAATSSSSR